MSARKISEMRNLGPASQALLAEIGIHNEKQLREIGAVSTFCRVRFQLGKAYASLNLLYAMEAALQDRDWRDLSPAEKAALKAQID